MKYWWTGDLHFCHFNIIRYANRPFKTLEEMDQTLIKNWNERVKPGDSVIDCGDWNFKNSSGGKFGEGLPRKPSYYEDQLNGRIIHIKGNHTRANGLNSIIEKIIIKYGGYQVCCVHNPIHAGVEYPFNFTAHVHQHWAFKELTVNNKTTVMCNVGVDVNNFMPVTFEEILRNYKRWKKENEKAKSQEITKEN